MNKDELAKLRELATKATPGPWKDDGVDVYSVTDGGNGFPLDRYPDSVDVVVGQCERCGSAQVGAISAHDSRYIAAANTTVVLALLDEIDRLRSVVIEDGEQIVEWKRSHAELCTEVMALRHQLFAMTAALNGEK